MFFSAHRGSVRSVAVDGLNQIVITAGADDVIRFWRFKSRELLETVEIGGQIAFFNLHRDRCARASIYMTIAHNCIIAQW